MLFTDTNVASPSLMLYYDGECENITTAMAREKGSAEITLDGLCSRAWQESRAKLEAALATFSTYVGSAGMQAHLAAVFNTGSTLGGFGTRASIRLSQIVVTDVYYGNSVHPIQQWATYIALRLLYEEAANRYSGDKKGDRFEAKRARYEDETDRLWQRIMSSGLPFLQSGYLDAPGALHSYNAGVWSSSNISTVTDLSNQSQGGTYAFAITYVDGTTYVSPTLKNNAESAPSAAITATATAGQLFSVNIASLNPPSPATIAAPGLSQGAAYARLASGWQIYAGTGALGAPMFLQNSTPIPISQTTFTLSSDPVLSGFQSTAGQTPDSYSNLIFGNQIRRG